MKLNIHFLSCISRAQWPYVAIGYQFGQCRYRTYVITEGSIGQCCPSYEIILGQAC